MLIGIIKFLVGFGIGALIEFLLDDDVKAEIQDLLERLFNI